MSTGMSLRSRKSDWSFMGASSRKKPIRFPSRPRTDSREALPTPPVERMVTPTVLARMPWTSLTVPCNCFMLMTDTGMACSRTMRASLLAVTVACCRVRGSAFRGMVTWTVLPLSTRIFLSWGR